MDIEIAWDKLAALLAASLGGGFGSLLCWAYRVSKRKTKNPYTTACVYFSLGMLFSVAMVESLELTEWGANIHAKIFLSIIAGCINGIWGPLFLLTLIVRIALEIDLILEDRRRRSRRDEDTSSRDTEETGSD